MTYTTPTMYKEGEIIQALAATFANRRSWIQKENPSANENFQKYPRLLDFEGEMARLLFIRNYSLYRFKLFGMIKSDFFYRLIWNFKRFTEVNAANFLESFHLFTPREF